MKSESASSYRNTTVASLYRPFEWEKQRRYEQRVREVEMGSITPLVFSAFGGLGGPVTTVYKRLVSLLLVKRDQFYGLVTSWLRCSITFCGLP